MTKLGSFYHSVHTSFIPIVLTSISLTLYRKAIAKKKGLVTKKKILMFNYLLNIQKFLRLLKYSKTLSLTYCCLGGKKVILLRWVLFNFFANRSSAEQSYFFFFGDKNHTTGSSLSINIHLQTLRQIKRNQEEKYDFP